MVVSAVSSKEKSLSGEIDEVVFILFFDVRGAVNQDIFSRHTTSMYLLLRSFKNPEEIRKQEET